MNFTLAVFCLPTGFDHGKVLANSRPLLGNWRDALPHLDELQMKAYIAELNDVDVNMSVPLDGNGCYLCFDIDKYGCIGQMPRIVRGSFLKKGYHREVRIPDELVLSVRTVAEVARATEPLIARVLDDYRGLCENWEPGAQKTPVIDV